MQILNTVGAPSSYTSHYNFLSYIPSSFSLVMNNSTDVFVPQLSPSSKRLHDDIETINVYPDEDIKRPRYDPVTGRETRPRNPDEENIAPVPTLIDANINMLRK